MGPARTSFHYEKIPKQYLRHKRASGTNVMRQYSMQNHPPRKPLLIIVLSIVVLLTISLAIWALGPSRKPKETPARSTDGLYYDKNSGETVSDPSWKTPDIDGTDPNL